MTIDDIHPDELEEFINSGGLHRHTVIESKPTPRGEAALIHQKDSNEIQDSNQSTTQETDRELQSEGVDVQSTGRVLQPILEELPGNSTTAEEARQAQPTRAEGFDFEDPVELLFFLDDQIAKGTIALHDWQIQFMVDFAAGGCDHEHPFHALVRAANGSGKDKYIIAACSVWLCMVNLRASAVVTSSSGVQLDNQTCRHISYLCGAANRKIDPRIWKINYRQYTCLATGSIIDCFATDEAGKAEGYHPLEFGCKMALFMSEAKTVPDEINTAFDRCDGYTHRIHVSSPGIMQGHFHDDCLTATPRSSIKSVTDVDPAEWIHYLITAYDCSHISRVRIQKLIDKYGIDDPLVQSSIFAEFSTFGERVIIPGNFVQQCVDKGEWKPEPFNKAGLDLADGGDETVLIVRNGNKVINICPFRLDNSDDTYYMVYKLFEDNDLNHPESTINADCGGIGKPTLDRLRKAGWSNIRYIDNRHPARDKYAFYKCATEFWWHLRELLQRKEIILPKDKKLGKQLAGRYYKLRDGILRHLLSKAEQKSKGYESPDRADGLVLAFLDYKSTWTGTSSATDKPFKQPPEAKIVPDLTMKEAASRHTENGQWNRNPSKNLDFSMLREDIELYNQQIRRQNNESLQV